MDERTRAAAALLAAGHPDPTRLALEDATGELADALRALADALRSAEEGDWRDAASTAATAARALDAAGRDDVDATALAAFATAVAADPEVVERRTVPALSAGGAPVTLDSLDADAALFAGETLAAAGGDEDLEAGFAYARDDFAAGETASQYIRLALDAVRGDLGAMPAERLRQRATRRRQRERDVEGLFD